MNLYVQWFIIASEDVPNLCIELFINAPGSESYFMKGVFMNFITYLAIYDCILACTLYIRYRISRNLGRYGLLGEGGRF